jgi:hypothetical protein
MFSEPHRWGMSTEGLVTANDRFPDPVDHLPGRGPASPPASASGCWTADRLGRVAGRTPSRGRAWCDISCQRGCPYGPLGDHEDLSIAWPRRILTSGCPICPCQDVLRARAERADPGPRDCRHHCGIPAVTGVTVTSLTAVPGQAAGAICDLDCAIDVAPAHSVARSMPLCRAKTRLIAADLVFRHCYAALRYSLIRPPRTC